MLDQLVRPAQTTALEDVIGGYEYPDNEFHFYDNWGHGIGLGASSDKGGTYGHHIQAWLNEIGGYD